MTDVFRFSDLLTAAQDAGFFLYPAGWYDVVVDSADAGTTNTQKPCINVKFKVVTGAYAGKNAKIRNKFTISADNANALDFFFRHMEAMGLPREYFAQNPKLPQVAAALVGRSARIKISDDRLFPAPPAEGGKPQNDVQEILPATGAPLLNLNTPSHQPGVPQVQQFQQPQQPAPPSYYPPQPAMPQPQYVDAPQPAFPGQVVPAPPQPAAPPVPPAPQPQPAYQAPPMPQAPPAPPQFQQPVAPPPPPMQPPAQYQPPAQPPWTPQMAEQQGNAAMPPWAQDSAVSAPPPAPPQAPPAAPPMQQWQPQLPTPPANGQDPYAVQQQQQQQQAPQPPQAPPAPPQQQQQQQQYAQPAQPGDVPPPPIPPSF